MQEKKIPTVIIIGAGLGGLALYHALIKNKDKKEFTVKIFERESGPSDRWQGYHIGLYNFGVRSLLNCVPSSTALNLPKGIPNHYDKEYHGMTVTDHNGDILTRPRLKQSKDIYEFGKSSGIAATIAYRDRLRDVLSENVPIQWGKKFIKYEETQEGVFVFFEDGSKEFCDILVGADGISSPVRKQKVPELKTNDFGITTVIANVAVPQHLADRVSKFTGNSLVWSSVGLDGDSTLFATRLIPIEQERDDKNENDNESHYRTTIMYNYSSELDKVESDDKVDDNDPASVIEHVKQIIQKSRPEGEITEILLELWDLAPKESPKDSENSPFKTYNPIQRRQLRDLDTKSANRWKTSRVTLLGDAAHAMSPLLALGSNNAFQDADGLSQALLGFTENDYLSCIIKYEDEMLKRTSANVMLSRYATIQSAYPVGYFGAIIRNSFMRLTNFALDVYNYFWG